MAEPGPATLAGRTALVTGAASGIGKAAAARLAAAGATVVLTDRRETALEEAAAEIRADGHRAAAALLDVTREDAWIAAVDRTVADQGRLDILVNNAGVGVGKDIEETTLEEYRLVNAVNAEGVFLGCKHGVRVMKETGGGSIVNVSSIAGIVGAPNLAAYCASKGAVRMLTKSVALHCARKGYDIRCNSVHPSYADTPMVEEMVAEHRDPNRYRAALERAAPLGRMAAAGDVAGAILFLAGDDSRFMTGAELVVDGGITAT